MFKNTFHNSRVQRAVLGATIALTMATPAVSALAQSAAEVAAPARITAYATTLQAPSDELSPAGTAVDQEGQIYVVAAGNDRIDIFAGNGSFLETWGDSGSGPGEFSFHDDAAGWSQGDIAIDSDGNLYVADPGNNRIQLFDADRTYVTSIYSQVSNARGDEGNSEFTPVNLAIDEDANSIYVADAGSGEVKVFSMEGAQTGSLRIAGAGNVAGGNLPGVAVSSDGAILTATPGGFITWVGSDLKSLLVDGGARNPAFAFSVAGLFYAANNDGVLVFTSNGTLMGAVVSELTGATYVSAGNGTSILVSYPESNTVVRYYLGNPAPAGMVHLK